MVTSVEIVCPKEYIRLFTVGSKGLCFSRNPWAHLLVIFALGLLIWLLLYYYKYERKSTEDESDQLLWSCDMRKFAFSFQLRFAVMMLVVFAGLWILYSAYRMQSDFQARLEVERKSKEAAEKKNYDRHLDMNRLLREAEEQREMERKKEQDGKQEEETKKRLHLEWLTKLEESKRKDREARKLSTKVGNFLSSVRTFLFQKGKPGVKMAPFAGKNPAPGV